MPARMVHLPTCTKVLCINCHSHAPAGMNSRQTAYEHAFPRQASCCSSVEAWIALSWLPWQTEASLMESLLT
jgi:hypothetical protein